MNENEIDGQQKLDNHSIDFSVSSYYNPICTLSSGFVQYVPENLFS